MANTCMGHMPTASMVACQIQYKAVIMITNSKQQWSHRPVLWKRKSGPAGPVDSRFRNTPKSFAQGLCCMNPCDAGQNASSAPFMRNTTGAASLTCGLAIRTRASSRIIPTQAASSEAPDRGGKLYGS